jgi:hypothetical protein
MHQMATPPKSCPTSKTPTSVPSNLWRLAIVVAMCYHMR